MLIKEKIDFFLKQAGKARIHLEKRDTLFK